MTPNLKTLGLALLAVFAISAIVASAASAANDTFELEGSPTTLTGTQLTGAGKNKFKFAGQFVECTTATFHATVTGTSVTEVAAITPTYGGCTYGTEELKVTMNGCTYTLTGTTDAEGDATTKIVCTTPNHITFDIGTCEVTVKKAGEPNGSLTATKGVHYTNEGTGSTRAVIIDLTATVPLIGDGVGCAKYTGNGVLTGEITLTGETETTNAHTGIEVKAIP